jgi:hypothetical protein
VTNWNVPHDVVLDESGQDPARRKWVLLEFVSLAILLSVGLTTVGGLIGGILYSHGSSGINNTASWLAIEFGSRWVNPPVAGLLLAELAVCWLSYGQWAGTSQDASPGVIRIHIRRLRWLIALTRIAFAAVLIAALASAVSLIIVDHEAIIGVPSGQVWGADIYGLFNALGVIALTSVGTFAANRLQRATARFLSQAPAETGSPGAS